MPRPIKIGLDYFPLDTGMDEKFELLEAKHGILGFGILIKLYQKVYREHGYFYPWTEREQLLFCKWVNVDINTVNAIIDDAIKYGIFDNKMAEKGILTSTGIQKRFIEASKRRMQISLYKDILLVNANIIPVNVGNKPRAVEFMQYFVCNNPYIKLNKSKLNKSKVLSAEEGPQAASPPEIKKVTSRFDKPTLDEIRAYCHERNNGVSPEKWLAHYEANGWKVGRNTMRDWKAAVRTWEADTPKPKPTPPAPPRKTGFKPGLICPTCSTPLPAGGQVCPHCGAYDRVLPPEVYEWSAA